MSTEEAAKKEDKQKPGTASEGFGPFEMMKMCCTGEGGFSDCASMMKSRMGAMATMPCCGSVINQPEPDRREK